MSIPVATIETQFQIPVTDNNGQQFPSADWEALEERLLEFGGGTVLAEIDGWWRDGGQVYRERSNRYLIDLESWEDLPRWLELVRWARERFGQIAIRIRVAGITDIIR